LGELRVLSGVAVQQALPFSFPDATLLDRLAEAGQGLGRDEEGRFQGPAQGLLGGADLVFAQGCAVGLGEVFTSAAVRVAEPSC
jgi:hypothetical protein